MDTWISAQEAAKVYDLHVKSIYRIVKALPEDAKRLENGQRFLKYDILEKHLRKPRYRSVTGTLPGQMDQRVTPETPATQDQLVKDLRDRLEEMKDRISWFERHVERMTNELSEQRTMSARLIEQVDLLQELSTRLALKAGDGSRQIIHVRDPE